MSFKGALFQTQPLSRITYTKLLAFGAYREILKLQVTLLVALAWILYIPFIPALSSKDIILDPGISKISGGFGLALCT